MEPPVRMNCPSMWPKGCAAAHTILGKPGTNLVSRVQLQEWVKPPVVTPFLLLPFPICCFDLLTKVNISSQKKFYWAVLLLLKILADQRYLLSSLSFRIINLGECNLVLDSWRHIYPDSPSLSEHQDWVSLLSVGSLSRFFSCVSHLSMICMWKHGCFHISSTEGAELAKAQ